MWLTWWKYLENIFGVLAGWNLFKESAVYSIENTKLNW